MKVAVDIVIFTIQDGALKVLLVKRRIPPFKEELAIPGGFVQPNEDLDAAALRELREETGVRSAEILDKTKTWIYYDLPPEAVGKALKGKFRGQRQLWFAMRFTGREDEINLHQHGHKPEFDAWRWASGTEVLDLIVGFKRPAYEAVMAEFKQLVKF